MEHATQVGLIERILELVASGSKDMVAAESNVPVSDYTDPARLERELEVLFRKLPLPVARSEQLPAAGSFLTCDRSRVPLLLTRDDSGALHAMINVCRHRGTRVVEQSSGTKSKFVCPYHAWTYDGCGRLIRVPDEAGFAGIAREDHGLVRLPVAERHGFVWVVPSPAHRLAPGLDHGVDQGLDIDRYLGALGDDFRAMSLDGHLLHRPVTFEKAINWKLAFDIFLEAYHLRYTHSSSIYPIFFDNLGLFERFHPHLRNIFPKRTIRELAGTDTGSWDLRPHANILYFIFPSSLMLVQPDHASFFSVVPRGTDSCSVHAYTLLPERPESEKALDYWAKNIEILHGAIAEDFARGESIQAGLRPGANRALTFGRFEQSLAWFHAAVNDALAAKLPAG